MEKNIFENAKFGDKFLFDGNQCLFLEKISMSLQDGSRQLYKLAVNVTTDITYTYLINARSDGFVYQSDDENQTRYYVTTCPMDNNLKEKYRLCEQCNGETDCDHCDKYNQYLGAVEQKKIDINEFTNKAIEYLREYNVDSFSCFDEFEYNFRRTMNE